MENNTRETLTMISDLISYMTVKGASSDELTRAIKYSLHVLNCEKAYEEADIEELRIKYMDFSKATNGEEK